MVLICDEREGLMNRGEVYTIKGTTTTKIGEAPRTANLDEKRDALQWETTDWVAVEQFINKAQTRIAKATAAGNTTLSKPVNVRQTLTYLRLEPYEGKPSSTVLRRERRGNPPNPADVRHEVV